MSSSISEVILSNRKLRVEGPLGSKHMFLKAARVVEAMSRVTETTVDFMSPDQKVDLGKLVGKTIRLKVQKGDDDWRQFVGTCIEAQYLGLREGFGYYTMELRSWPWFLTRTANNRIFQDLTAVEIIKQVLGDRGFSDYTLNVSRGVAKRIYTVQYNETDYDFLSRLMEEEGIYFFSIEKDGADHLMVADGLGAHAPVPGFPTINFAPREQEYRRATDHIFEWRGAEAVTSGKVTLRDYNFEKPKADMTSVSATPKGSHSHKGYEVFAYPGRYRETSLGDQYARIRMEAEAVKFQTRHGIGNVRTLANGALFKLQNQNRDAENQDYLITAATHMMQIEVQKEEETEQVKELPGAIEFDERNRDSYRCTFQAIPKNTPFRAPHSTPWPKIPGILVARVTGPSGEEIYTDQYGRIKVQFPWDRDGQNDEHTTCWVRVVTPWSGKAWGMIAVPRIGQEVVIQFEDGDPDRPICTGMLYNADTMPPYALPDNMTQSGVKTNSSKGGGGFNELMFEDKKDKELVRLQSEKDYVEIIKNNATITIGLEKKDPGDLTMTVQNSRTETIKKGDLTLTVETGNEKRDIKTDRTEKIGANAKQEVGGNKETKVTGNQKTDVTGNKTEDVTGSFTSKVMQSISIESMVEIELKVGASSIKLDHSGITIKGILITTEAQGMAQHKASGMMIIQGGITMIN